MGAVMDGDKKKTSAIEPNTLAEQAKVSPTTVFGSPKQVVATDDLTGTEKTEVLAQWEADAIALQKATDEGMTGGERPRLEEVKKAQTLLDEKKKRDPSKTS
jgi:hypothetical protein